MANKILFSFAVYVNSLIFNVSSRKFKVFFARLKKKYTLIETNMQMEESYNSNVAVLKIPKISKKSRTTFKLISWPNWNFRVKSMREATTTKAVCVALQELSSASLSRLQSQSLGKGKTSPSREESGCAGVRLHTCGVTGGVKQPSGRFLMRLSGDQIGTGHWELQQWDASLCDYPQGAKNPMDWLGHQKIVCSTDLCNKEATRSYWFPWKRTSRFFLCEETELSLYERIQIKLSILWKKWRNSQYNLPSDSSLQLLLFSEGRCGFSEWLYKILRAFCHGI